MSELLLSTTFWLTSLNVVLGVIVFVPLLLVTLAIVREIVVRILRRRRDVEWTTVPGVGRIPVLKEDRKRRGSRRIRTAGGPGLGS